MKFYLLLADLPRSIHHDLPAAVAPAPARRERWLERARRLARALKRIA